MYNILYDCIHSDHLPLSLRTESSVVSESVGGGEPMKYSKSHTGTHKTHLTLMLMGNA